MNEKQTESHERLKKELTDLIEGEVKDSEDVLETYSRDTSLFKVRPELVVCPKNPEDVKKIVRYVAEHKSKNPKLSITGRSAGTDMTGGPLNESLILSFTEHINGVEVDEDNMEATVEPGAYYRDFEKNILPDHLSYPPYPASKTIAAMGGVVMNNSGGEETLRWGKTEDYVKEVTMVLSDGNEYTFGKISRDELEAKKSQQNFEGEIYRKVFDLVDQNQELIQSRRPRVSKNSAGYDLWRIWDGEHFDLSKLFVGSQGTLGMFLRARLRLVKEKPNKKMLVLFFKSWDSVPDVVNEVLPFDPESLEVFDRDTMILALRFFPAIAKSAGKKLIPFLWHFLPEAWVGVKMLGMPKLVMIVELAEDTEAEADKKAQEIAEKMKSHRRVWTRLLPNKDEEEKYWIIRRQSFSLLRQNVKGKVAAPFVEDFCILPEKMPEFLPKMLAIMKEYGIKANLVGHAGNGNYHTIPLMNLKKASEREKIPVVADKIYKLVIEYGGTITAEHNDGILRTPYLEEMYGKEMTDLFAAVKNIFDPQNIFNPGKKVGGSKEYFKAHMAED
ncbi:MAG TPA: FAD-binding oxidoreductase [Candidatus Paceibacterota bacterium]|nr:FAD-binding oxidoreductase [Candidatus Paceibacterota bacterium]